MDYLFIISVGLFLILVLLLSLLTIVNYSSKSNKLPPGPPQLPIIGNLHLLGKNPHQSLAELSKTYGPIMSLKLGRITTIVISSSSAAKQVLQKQDHAFSNRFIPDAVNSYNHSQFSVSWLPVATVWRSLRKLMTTNIFSNNALEANQHLRSQKIGDLVDYCRHSSQTGGGAVDIGRAAFTTSLNLLSNTIFSKDLTDPNDESVKELKQLVREIMIEAGKPNLVDYFPVLKNIDPQGIRRRMTAHFGKVVDLFDGIINERMESMKLKSGTAAAGYRGDVLDSCLNVCQENLQEINRIHIRHMFLDLFAAGTDTTSSTVEWAMAELLRNQDIMTKARTELELFTGKGNILEEANVSQLPYLQCIVKETLRLHPPVPLLLPRKVDSDVELNGFIVPKDSQVLVNVWAIGRDPVSWEDPLNFKPERFLSSEVNVRGQDFELIPFGGGRRICPGLPLAIRMVPMILGSLVISFKWEIDGGIGAKELDMDERFGITLVKARPLLAVPLPLSV